VGGTSDHGFVGIDQCFHGSDQAFFASDRCFHGFDQAFVASDQCFRGFDQPFFAFDQPFRRYDQRCLQSDPRFRRLDQSPVPLGSAMGADGYAEGSATTAAVKEVAALPLASRPVAGAGLPKGQAGSIGMEIGDAHGLAEARAGQGWDNPLTGESVLG
jgi:hypothetical protein